MELEPAEKRSIWWKGALKSGLKSLAIGLASGLVAAAGLYGISLIFPVGLSLIGSFVAPGGVFNPIPLMIFNGVISSAIGLFTGGSQAVAAYHQNKHNARDEAKLIELDGRTRELEQTVSHPATSRNLQQILQRGPRGGHRETAEAVSDSVAQQAAR